MASIYNNSIKCILFDLDNTLIETRKADAKVCDKIAIDLKFKYNLNHEEAKCVSVNFLKNFRKCPENTAMSLDKWRTFLWSQALGEKYEQYADSIYTTWLILRYQHLALSKDLTSLLKSLKKKFQIALISNGTSAAQWEKIEKLNLKDCFDVILVSGDLLCEKPDKDIFLNACKQLDVHPKSCLMVGDKLETDILGGIEAGLAGTVWIPLNSHYNLNETDPKPQYILKDIMELRYLLTNIDEFHKKMAYKHKKRGSISSSASQFNYNDEDASSSSSFLEHSSSKKINMKFLQFSRLHLEEDSNNSNASDGS